ncbi:MAG: hypothetical protein A4E19_19725 [Nitrospira sp. SG-bin1]|nr:MAG: hypothetical protein A4E19_19725 [Nitrospira sp. SG-bin1]
MKIRTAYLYACLFLSVFIDGCNRYQVIPDRLAAHVNEKLSYEQVQTSPDTYRGKLVVWGGVVLKAVRNAGRTSVEVLELPLNTDHIPLGNQASSRGRFLAIDSRGEITDPAILKDGSRVTVIGEVIGLRRDTLDNAEYDYPLVEIHDMTLWDERPRAHYPFADFHNYYGYGFYGRRPHTFGEETRVAGSES